MSTTLSFTIIIIIIIIIITISKLTSGIIDPTGMETLKNFSRMSVTTIFFKELFTPTIVKCVPLTLVALNARVACLLRRTQTKEERCEPNKHEYGGTFPKWITII